MTKYSYGILKGAIGLRLRDIIRDICTENKVEIIKGNVCSNHVHGINSFLLQSDLS